MMKVVEEEQRIHVMEGEWDSWGVIRDIVEGGQQEDPFYVMDLGEVVARYNRWKELMPRVVPFYAVKCNDDKLMITTLAALGAGFDCASKAEIELVTSVGVRPERIIFANPAKMASHIRYASATGVQTMTFDSEEELIKIKQLMPDAQLVIRIRCDAADAQCPLGVKFGCDPVAEAPRLLKLAAVLQLDVAGVSFHVGSAARDFAAYAQAIKYSRALFDCGAVLGHTRMRLLDVGGGFLGTRGTKLDEVAAIINAAIASHFPENYIRVIAEPGRYFAAAAYTLAVMVYAKRKILPKESELSAEAESHTMYFMNDGVYGSFNCVLTDHLEVVHVEPLHPSSDKTQPCSVWGPSCDALDCVFPAARLPPLQVGSWLIFREMGAYSIPLATGFNGFPVPKVRAVIDRTVWSAVKSMWPLTEAHFVLGSRMTGPQILPASPLPTPIESGPVFVECAPLIGL